MTLLAPAMLEYLRTTGIHFTSGDGDDQASDGGQPKNRSWFIHIVTSLLRSMHQHL
jgi:hypothetical protein